MSTSIGAEQKTSWVDLLGRVVDTGAAIYTNDQQAARDLELAKYQASAAAGSVAPETTGQDYLGRTVVQAAQGVPVNFVALGVAGVALVVAGALALHKPKGK